MALVPSMEIKNRFGYHRANATSAPEHSEIREAYEALGHWLNEHLPPGRDASLALTELQSSMHWANSAVAMQNPLADDPAVPTP